MASPKPSALKGLKILITRPAARSGELRAALQSAGAEVWEQALLDIKPLDASRHSEHIRTSRSRILDLDRYQRLIFISVNAVQYGLELIDQYWPQWPMGIAVHAIGDATANALRQNGIPVDDTAAAMNSESLLASGKLQALQNEKILILRGIGGREYLAQQLRLRGAHVDYVECYERRSPNLADGELRALLVKHQLQVVCLNSGETLANFHRHCPPSTDALEPILLLPGQRVTEQARALGYNRLLQAENAGTAASLAALCQMMREENERR